MRMYIQYKLRNKGIGSSVINESYSSRTCCHCLNVLSYSPRDRNYSCPSCGMQMHRDAVGGSNICSKGKYGSYGSVVPKEIIYLRPMSVKKTKKVVVPRTQGSPALLAMIPIGEHIGVTVGNPRL